MFRVCIFQIIKATVKVYKYYLFIVLNYEMSLNYKERERDRGFYLMPD